MRRTRIRRKSKSPIKKLQDILWELCKTIIRKKYGNVCFTCGAKELFGSNWHTGHFIPSAAGGAFLRHDLRNLRPQCYNCNINLGGNGSMFYKRLVETEGQAYVDQLFRDKQKIIKADRIWYEQKINEYKKLCG